MNACRPWPALATETLRASGTLLLLALALAGWTAPAVACSCARLPPLELVRSAPAIFEARILEARITDTAALTIEVIAEPTDIWKGTVPGRAVLSSTAEALGCGVFGRRLPPVGQTILAAASSIGGDGVFSLSSCTFHGSGAALEALRGPASERRRLDAAVDAAPGSLAPIFARARSRERWDPDGAATAYAALAREHPELPAAHLGLGRALLYATRAAEAVPALERAVALTSSDPEPAGLLAQARFRLGDSAALDGLRNFQGIRLRRLDVTGRDLRHANFTDAAIDEFQSAHADLRAASFRHAYFGAASADLRAADLRRADLVGLEARQINLNAARLDQSRLDGAALDHAQFVGASLRNIHAQSATLEHGNFRRADLSGARLLGTSLLYASFVDANLRGTDLRGADMRATDLRGADLRGANLAGVNLAAAFHDCRTRLPRGVDPVAQDMIVPPEACTPR